MKSDKTYTEAKLGGELYEVSMKIVPAQDQAHVFAAIKRDLPAADLSTWHRRLGHLGDTMLKNLVNSSAVKGMDITNSHLEGICEDCIMGKMDEKPFSIRNKRDSQIFGMLHADLMGPMNPEARWTHAKFSLVINDDCSGFGFVFNMQHKDEATKTIIKLDKAVETKFQKRVHTLRTDNGGELVNHRLQEYCQGRGITMITSVAYNLELNGHAERRNRTHIEGARTMLKDSELGKDLWGEAISTHIYIHNRCPSSILPNHITPYERIFGHPPSIAHLRVFGSKCFIKIPDETHSKLDDKALECRLLGYEGDSIYVVVDSDKKKLRSRNVIFLEGRANRVNKDEPVSVVFPVTESTTEQAPAHTRSAYIEEVTDMGDGSKKRSIRSEVWGSDPVRRSKRLSNQEASKEVSEKVLVTRAISSAPEIRTPRAYNDAINSPEGKLWKEAMDYELAKLEEMNTWSEVDKSDVLSGTQILPGMWVHLIKNLETGGKKFRSRWVVRGDKQKTNLSLSDTFAPVSRITSLRILLALATLKNLRIFAWDIDSAYLHGKIDHELYVDFPDGYERPGKVGN